VGEQRDQWQEGLHAEVEGEDALLQGGELGPWKDAEGDDAGDEGLEDGRPEEGAIAGEGVSLFSIGRKCAALA